MVTLPVGVKLIIIHFYLKCQKYTFRDELESIYKRVVLVKLARCQLSRPCKRWQGIYELNCYFRTTETDIFHFNIFKTFKLLNNVNNDFRMAENPFALFKRPKADPKIFHNDVVRHRFPFYFAVLDAPAFLEEKLSFLFFLYLVRSGNNLNLRKIFIKNRFSRNMNFNNDLYLATSKSKIWISVKILAGNHFRG